MFQLGLRRELLQVTPNQSLNRSAVPAVRATLDELGDDLDLDPERLRDRTHWPADKHFDLLGLALKVKSRRREDEIAASPLTASRMMPVARVASLAIDTEANGGETRRDDRLDTEFGQRVDSADCLFQHSAVRSVLQSGHGGGHDGFDRPH